jgi:hypothetical protein
MGFARHTVENIYKLLKKIQFLIHKIYFKGMVPKCQSEMEKNDYETRRKVN